MIDDKEMCPALPGTKVHLLQMRHPFRRKLRSTNSLVDPVNLQHFIAIRVCIVCACLSVLCLSVCLSVYFVWLWRWNWKFILARQQNFFFFCNTAFIQHLDSDGTITIKLNTKSFEVSFTLVWSTSSPVYKWWPFASVFFTQIALNHLPITTQHKSNLWYVLTWNGRNTKIMMHSNLSHSRIWSIISKVDTISA